jgi:hypothetical protein
MNRLLLLAFLISPLSAHADLLYKCTTEEGSRLGAQIRFTESGRNGYLEVDDWADYPPSGLVYASLHETTAPAGGRIFLSEEDRHSGASAELSLPRDFLANKDFRATLTLVRKDSSRESTRLSCAGF